MCILGNVNTSQGCLSYQQVCAVHLASSTPEEFPEPRVQRQCLRPQACSEESGSSASNPQLGHMTAACLPPLESPPCTHSTVTAWSITDVHVVLPSYPSLGLGFA